MKKLSSIAIKTLSGLIGPLFLAEICVSAFLAGSAANSVYLDKTLHYNEWALRSTAFVVAILAFLVSALATLFLTGCLILVVGSLDNYLFPTEWTRSMLKAVDARNVNHDDYQVIGYRLANLTKTEEGVRFKSMVHKGTTFGARAGATCIHQEEWYSRAHQEQHQAPVDDCTCGWYSRPHAFSLADLRRGNSSSYYASAMLLLECHYTGKIIPRTTGTMGARAQTQHVLKAWIPRYCGFPLCHSPAVEFLNSETGWRTSCGKHKSEDVRYALVDLRNELGCEFEFV